MLRRHAGQVVAVDELVKEIDGRRAPESGQRVWAAQANLVTLRRSAHSVQLQPLFSYYFCVCVE